MRAWIMAVLVGMAGAWAQPAMAQGCAAKLSVPWAGADGVSIVVASSGPKCASAKIRLDLRDRAGTETEVYVGKVDENAAFYEVTDLASMKKALGEWIVDAAKARKTTADLPRWAKGKEQPMSGEFPFYPEEGVDRSMYEELRGLKRPMLCFVQGMESEACIFLDGHGDASKIGAQSFPG